MSQHCCKSTRHTIPKNNLFSIGRSISRCLWGAHSHPYFWGSLLEWRGASCRLGCQWSHTNVLTPDFSTKLSQFIKYSLSCGQDFNCENTSFRFDHPTMAFLGQALGNSKNLWCQLRISSHNRISRFGFPFFFNIYFFFSTSYNVHRDSNIQSIWLCVPAPWWLAGWRTHCRRSFELIQQNLRQQIEKWWNKTYKSKFPLLKEYEDLV